MKHIRLISNIAIALSIALLPWWVVLALFVGLSIAIRNNFELLLWGALYDAVFTADLGYSFSYWGTAAGLALTLVSFFVRPLLISTR